MSDFAPPTRALPASPNLEQQKKLARELVTAARAGDKTAVARFRAHHPRYTQTANDSSDRQARSPSLHEAQLVIAREYGFASWPTFKHHIESLSAARQTRIFVREVSYYQERAEGLLAVVSDGLEPALAQVRQWHPKLSGASDEEIRAAGFTIADARIVYARQHGFERWSDMLSHLHRLSPSADEEPFLAVFEAGRRGDWPRISRLLREHPELVRVGGTNGNTLLNLSCSLSPCAPPRAPDNTGAGDQRLAAVQFLSAAGADVAQANDRGWTPLHQAAYRNDPEMAALLTAAHAPVDSVAHGTGGTPLAVALFWGHREVSELLAQVAVVPANLRIAAGVGRLDVVEGCFDPNGELTAEARANRGFYRPHSGFPTWRSSNDRQEIVDEALVWAAKSGRTNVMPQLLTQGALIDADPYRGTPLIWAAANGRVETVQWLLDHGADVNRRATFGGPSHGEGVTALHLAAQDNRVDVIRLMLARGADPTITDELHGSTPAGWAEHCGAADALGLLKR